MDSQTCTICETLEKQLHKKFVINEDFFPQLSESFLIHSADLFLILRGGLEKFASVVLACDSIYNCLKFLAILENIIVCKDYNKAFFLLEVGETVLRNVKQQYFFEEDTLAVVESIFRKTLSVPLCCCEMLKEFSSELPSSLKKFHHWHCSCLLMQC